MGSPQRYAAVGAISVVIFIFQIIANAQSRHWAHVDAEYKYRRLDAADHGAGRRLAGKLFSLVEGTEGPDAKSDAVPRRRLCADTTYGATDTGYDGCSWYNYNTGSCGNYDDYDFSANSMRVPARTRRPGRGDAVVRAQVLLVRRRQ